MSYRQARRRGGKRIRREMKVGVEREREREKERESQRERDWGKKRWCERRRKMERNMVRGKKERESQGVRRNCVWEERRGEEVTRATRKRELEREGRMVCVFHRLRGKRGWSEKERGVEEQEGIKWEGERNAEKLQRKQVNPTLWDYTALLEKGVLLSQWTFLTPSLSFTVNLPHFTTWT